jgi:hypothetical protein
MPPLQRTLDLPPPFRLVTLREAGDAFAHASAHAAELGAGTLVFAGRFDVAEFALVLEPEEKLVEARRTFYAGMAALADALSALAPPETSITVEWPDAFAVDGGLVGGGRLAWPPGTDEGVVPDWLVFGAVIRLDEGFAGLAADRLAKGFARHLMVAIDRWQEGDFAKARRELSCAPAARARCAAGNRREREPADHAPGQPGQVEFAACADSAVMAPASLRPSAMSTPSQRILSGPSNRCRRVTGQPS